MNRPGAGVWAFSTERCRSHIRAPSYHTNEEFRVFKKLALTSLVSLSALLGTVAAAAAYTCPPGTSACTIIYYDGDGNVTKVKQGCCPDDGGVA
jgi:hypothetical protein